MHNIFQASTTKKRYGLFWAWKENMTSNSPERVRFGYTGIQCDTSNPRQRRLSQCHYNFRPQRLNQHASFLAFRSMWDRLTCITDIRPEITFAISKVAQIIIGYHNFCCNIFLNRVMRYVKRAPHTSSLLFKT